MNGGLFLLFLIGILGAGYFLYGRKLEVWFGVGEGATPAHRLRDGLDYEPAPLPVLFGHHFASIAGAGPIIGPILAASYGWLGVVLWLVLGAIFAGGVHDMGAILASVKHEGRSIGELIRRYLRPEAQKIFLLFAWVTLVLIIAAFDVIVAKTFVHSPQVATASLFFLALALGFGVLKAKGFSVFGLTVGGILGLVGAIWLGFVFPLKLSQNLWQLLLFGYVFLAAVTPVWLLLQPRDYLNAYLLYALLLGGVLGVIFKGPPLRLPVFTGFTNELGPLFPILFVITSCGAISGFHSLVGSGTTAKQLSRERDARPVGYGAMLLECVLGLLALLAVATLSFGDYQALLKAKGPIAAFANGIGGFLEVFGLPREKGVAFAALAVSAFALTSLDTATRVARLALEELLLSGSSARRGRVFLTTVVSVGLAAFLALTGTWRSIWPLMGTANQLLAALALLALLAWLKATGHRFAFVKWPAVFMFLVTLTALTLILVKNLRGQPILSLLALMLLIFALYLAKEGIFLQTPGRSPQRTL